MVSFVCFVNIFTLIALTVSAKKTKVSFKKKEKVKLRPLNSKIFSLCKIMGNDYFTSGGIIIKRVNNSSQDCIRDSDKFIDQILWP